ncbi:hypothetical protein LEP1GSC074_1805 [Leptospira noguchii str. Hook]|nr:hypothetical protein LEP1GSC074_1805 [Leptospira noguchii str. Hook]
MSFNFCSSSTFYGIQAWALEKLGKCLSMGQQILGKVLY